MLMLGVAGLSGCVVASSSSSTNGSVGGSFFLLFVPFALVAAAFAMASSGRRRRSLRSAVDDGDTERVNPQLLRAELSVLADDVLRLEPLVVMKDDARSDFDAATYRYRVAQAAMEYTDAPVDLVRVQRVVDEASYSMSRVRAILEDRRPPDPPTTLRSPGLRGEPAIVLDEGDRPSYEGSSASFSAGWFGGGGGLISGLLLGSVMGGFGGWIVEDADDDSEPDGRTPGW